MRPDDNLTRLINQSGRGDANARRELLEVIYPRLLDIARRVDWQARTGGQTQAMELLSEAVVRLGKLRREWTDRSHFYATFAHAIRSVRVDEIRRRSRSPDAIEIDDDAQSLIVCDGLDPCDVLDLDSALRQIEEEQPLAAQIITMRFFLDMTREAVAKDLGVPLSQVKKLWSMSRNRLQVLLRPERSSE